MYFFQTLLLTLSISYGTAHPTAVQPASTISTVHEFPNNTWLENIIQRECGLLLTTEFTAPNLWQIDPSKPANQKPVLVATFPEKLGLYGITEIAPDIFAVIGGNFSLETGVSTEGSFSIYRVDLNKSPASTAVIANFPKARLLNGMVMLPPTRDFPKGVLFTTDSRLGAIWSLDLATLKPTVWLQDPLMTGCGPIGIGADGLKYDPPSKSLIFSNPYCQGGFLATVPVDLHTYKAKGKASIVGGKAQGVPIDDLVIDPEARLAYVAGNAIEQIFSVNLDSGALKHVAGRLNSTEVANPTAVIIGKTPKGSREELLYVSTTGGYPTGINGTVIGGQVLAIKIPK